MTTSMIPQTAPKLLQTALAKPYHYRRSGRYYLRLRPQGSSTGYHSVSLLTNDKATAMTISQDILSALAVFHLDNTGASWDELRDHLYVIAEEALTMAHGDSSLVAYESIYGDLSDNLRKASSQMAMTSTQQQGLSKAQEVLKAAHGRLHGDSGALADLVTELGAPHSHASPCVSLSVSASQGTSQGTSSGITFNELSTLYIEEHKANVEPATLRDIQSVCKTLSGAFAGLDLKGHTRADMVALKGALMVDRQGSTVNKLLTRLSTVMSWAVNNGYLDKSFDKGLKLTKDADSSRRAFSKDQVARLMVAANSLPVTDETRWAVSVGVLTGARIAEVLQLTRKDIVEVNGQWVVSINADDGKSVKTKSSLRVVPLTDEAYGFDLKDLLGFVAGSPEGNALFCSGSRSATQERLNRFIKKTLGLDKGKASLSFHSLRHSLAGALKAAEVPVGTAEAILGHSSGSISYDLYGAGSAVEVGRMADGLVKALMAL